jgi:hypothetical protein
MLPRWREGGWPGADAWSAWSQSLPRWLPGRVARAGRRGVVYHDRSIPSPRTHRPPDGAPVVASAAGRSGRGSGRASTVDVPRRQLDAQTRIRRPESEGREPRAGGRRWSSAGPICPPRAGQTRHARRARGVIVAARCPRLLRRPATPSTRAQTLAGWRSRRTCASRSRMAPCTWAASFVLPTGPCGRSSLGRTGTGGSRCTTSPRHASTSTSKDLGPPATGGRCGRWTFLRPAGGRRGSRWLA